jgi:hypothetical protein
MNILTLIKLRPQQVKVIYPESVSKRRLPVNFEQKDSPLFEHEFQKTIPATRLLEFENAKVNSKGMIFRRGRFFLDGSFAVASQIDDWAKPKNLFKLFAGNYVLRNSESFDEDAVWVTDNWSNCYFHWMTDVLPRLYAIHDRTPDATLLLPDWSRAFEYTLSSLAPFAINKIKYIDRKQVLLCRTLITPTHTAPTGNYNEAIVRALRDLYTKHYRTGENGLPSDKVYISRGKAQRRRIANEDAILPILKEYGFKIFHFEDHPFEQQVKIILNARHIVSNHGAGLTNMLFLAAGGSVFELRRDTDSHLNCYFSLASALGLNYFYELCEAQNSNDDSYTGNLLINPEAFRKNIELMLAG